MLLALAAMAAVAAVAAAALLAVGGMANGGAALAHAQSLLSQQQEADMMHDALRSDVLASVSVNPDTSAVTLVQTARDAQQLRAGLAATQAQLAVLNDPGLTVDYQRTRDSLDDYATAAEHLVALSVSDEAAAQRALPEFNTKFEAARQRMKDLTARLRTNADTARAGSDRTAKTGRLRTTEIGGLSLLLLLSLTMAVHRSVKASLKDKALAECAVSDANRRLTLEAARERFDATLKDAFEMAVSEPEAESVVRRAVTECAPGQHAELLLADNSRAHMTRVMAEPRNDPPGCGVLSPNECVAVRRGRAMVFDDPEGVGACPKLAGRGTEFGQAVCSPVTFLGEGLGVLHVVTRPEHPLEARAIRNLAVTAEQAGGRIGTLRAFARSQLQANTDSLTGLLNRRTVEERIGELQRSGRQLAVAMCDLDHFKKINDTFGHEAGDRALRVFSATLRAVMRNEDLIARFGGEEFVLVMPDCGLRAAEDALDRIRTELALTLQSGGAASFTASFGLVLLRPDGELERALKSADDALMTAKAAGRNRVAVVDGTVTAG